MCNAPRDASALTRGGRRRGGPARGAHTEVERRHARGNGLRRGLSDPRAAGKGRSPRGGASSPRADRGGASLTRAGARGGARESADVSALIAPGTVLVADDNRMNRLLLGRSLEQEGHAVVLPRM